MVSKVITILYLLFLPPANVVCEGYIFTGVCDSVKRGGAWLLRGGGRAWLLRGGGGGVRGCSQGGHAWLLGPGGHAWFLPGGACVVFPWGGACIGYDEIRSMSGRYASYWNAFLLTLELVSSYKVRVPRVLETESVPELDARSGLIWLSSRSVAHLAPILAVTGLFPPLSVQKICGFILKEIEFGCRLLTRLKRSMKNTGDTDRIETLKPYHGLFTFTLLKNF